MQLEKYYPNQNIPQDIQAMLQLTGGNITLESLWALMDLAWATTKANENDSASMSAFYAHPVWTLNGFFTEWHKESIENREHFATYITNTKPKRIADYGGGFGALARLLAEKNPNCVIEVVEPFPSEIAISISRKYENIMFVDSLTGQYDVIVALDVLEHVTNPLDLVYNLAKHVDKKGYLLLANCFYPVIKCHLPCTFYLRHKFDFLVEKMGLRIKDSVLYGKAYTLENTMKHPNEIKPWIAMAKVYYKWQQAKPLIKETIKHLIKRNENTPS